MPRKTEIQEGERIGRLTIIKEVEPIKYKKYNERRVLCRCDCGTLKTVSFYQLKHGRIFSCGCYLKEIASERGKSSLKYNKEATSSRLYSIWHGMKCRCNTKTSGSYNRYGKRGVRVCEEWNNDFIPFYNWAIENGYSDGLTIDRIDTNGDYKPSNCRWVDYIVQANNRRTSVYLSYNGETHTVSEWSRILNVKNSVIYRRRKKGWSDEEIISILINN